MDAISQNSPRSDSDEKERLAYNKNYLASRQKFLNNLTGTMSPPTQLFNIVSYFSVLKKIAKKQDIITPIGNQLALADASLIKQKARCSIQELLTFVKEKNGNLQEGEKRLNPILISEKRVFSSFLEGKSEFDFKDCSRKIFLTQNKADHQKDIFSVKSPESLFVQLEKFCKPAPDQQGQLNVVILSTIGLNMEIVRNLLSRTHASEVNDFFIVTDVTGFGSQQSPLISYLPNDHSKFPSFTNCMIQGKIQVQHRPVLVLNLVSKQDDFNLANGDYKNKDIITSNLQKNYYRLVFPLSQILRRVIESVGTNANGQNPQYLRSSEVFEMLDDTFSKSVIEEEDLDAQVSAQFAETAAVDDDLLSLLIDGEY